MRRTRPQKTADISVGPLLNQEANGSVRFLRGPHKGKALSEISNPTLKKLCEASYPHATDAVLLLNALLSADYGRPMTAASAKEAMRADWEAMKAQTQARLDEIDQQPTLSQKVLSGLAGKLNEAAHEADSWPLSPPEC